MKRIVPSLKVILFTILTVNAHAQNVGTDTCAPQEKLYVVGYIRSNHLASADTNLVIADQLGTLRIFPFPNDSTRVLGGNATWGTLP